MSVFLTNSNSTPITLTDNFLGFLGANGEYNFTYTYDFASAGITKITVASAALQSLYLVPKAAGISPPPPPLGPIQAATFWRMSYDLQTQIVPSETAPFNLTAVKLTGSLTWVGDLNFGTLLNTGGRFMSQFYACIMAVGE